MKKCCECNKLVFPWQGSSLAGNSIHQKCHQKILEEAASDPVIRELMRVEICSFEKQIGVRSNVNVP